MPEKKDNKDLPNADDKENKDLQGSSGETATGPQVGYNQDFEKQGKGCNVPPPFIMEICPWCDEMLTPYWIFFERDVFTGEKHFYCRHCHNEIEYSPRGWVRKY